MNGANPNILPSGVWCAGMHKKDKITEMTALCYRQNMQEESGRKEQHMNSTSE